MSEFVLEPQLRRWPDARRASVPLVHPLLFAYLGLMLGAPVAALLACYNAIVLRRWVLLLVSLACGVAGWFAFIETLTALLDTGYAFVAGRAVYFAFGCVLYFLHRHHTEGHVFLGGRLLPVLPMYAGAFLLLMIMPIRLFLWLLGVWS